MRPISGGPRQAEYCADAGSAQYENEAAREFGPVGLAAFFLTGPGCASVLGVAGLDIRNPRP
jgi:hypothetical protein